MSTSLTGARSVRQSEPHVMQLEESSMRRGLFGALLARSMPGEDVAIDSHRTEEHSAVRWSHRILEGVFHVAVKRVQHGYGIASSANASHTPRG